MTDRYSVTNSQGAFQPGSNDTVLLNKLGLTSEEEINEVEMQLLERLYVEALITQPPDRRLSVSDLKQWHHL